MSIDRNSEEKQKVTRRDFLRLVFWGLAGMVLGSCGITPKKETSEPRSLKAVEVVRYGITTLLQCYAKNKEGTPAPGCSSPPVEIGPTTDDPYALTVLVQTPNGTTEKLILLPHPDAFSFDPRENKFLADVRKFKSYTLRAGQLKEVLAWQGFSTLDSASTVCPTSGLSLGPKDLETVRALWPGKITVEPPAYIPPGNQWEQSFDNPDIYVLNVAFCPTEGTA